MGITDKTFKQLERDYKLSWAKTGGHGTDYMNIHTMRKVEAKLARVKDRLRQAEADLAKLPKTKFLRATSDKKLAAMRKVRDIKDEVAGYDRWLSKYEHWRHHWLNANPVTLDRY
jgi:hypothetical protein